MTEKEAKKEAYIKIKSDSRICRINPGSFELSAGEEVLVDSEQCQEVAYVLDKQSLEEAAEDADITLVRRLNEKDREKLLERAKEAEETLEVCKQKIEKHNLAMGLLGADLSCDGKKLTFYFSAPGRVDFRSLVPDLAATFKKLIRLQQVGSRDKAKCIGGFGRCGQGLCCKKFLKGDLENITMEMAAEQNLGNMGNGRVTGMCGKMMCCLKYELDYYRNARKKMPAIGSEMKTPEGKGRVVSTNIMKNKINVELSDDKRIVEVDC